MIEKFANILGPVRANFSIRIALRSMLLALPMPQFAPAPAASAGELRIGH